MRRVCVFCGSRMGGGDRYRHQAERLGRLLADRGLGLVYGGGHVGLMGALADAVLAAGGEAIGVIPRALVERELAHRGLTRMHVVDTMHQRKALMADLSDAFLALPGGYGTLDELFEILSWAQLGLHAKPIGLLNQEGYFTPLLAWLDHALEEKFLKPRDRALLLDAAEPAALLELLLRGQPADRPAEARPEDR